MPAIVGPISVLNVTGGSVQVGDLLNMAPKSSSKTIAGSGAANTGGFVITNNGISFNNIADIDGIDQPITGNV